MNKKELQVIMENSDRYIAYAGKIVNILASGKSLKDVENQLAKSKIKEATITYIPPLDKSFSPLCQL